jgi:hypothetical protein
MPGSSAQEQMQPALVRIASISPWVDAEHPFTLSVRVTNTAERALDGVRLAVVFHGRVISRSELRQALDAGAGGTVGTISQPPVATISPGEQTVLTITRPAARLPVRRTGVYPIDIVIAHSAGSTTLNTAMPLFSGELPPPINVAWIVPIARPIVIGADGTFTRAGIGALSLDELVQQMNALAAHAGAGVTLAPSGATIDQLQKIARGYILHDGATRQAVGPESPDARRAREALDAMRRAVAAGEIATAPFAPADPRSLRLNGLGDDLLRQVTLGRAVTANALGSEPTSVFVPPGGALDAASASAVGSLGIDTFVIDPTMLIAQPTEPFRPDQFGPSRPLSLKLGATDARALMIDASMSQRIDAARDGALLAQALIAETASAYLELPLFAEQRALIISSSRTPSPVALRQGIAAFKAAPWVTLRRAGDVARSFPPIGDPGTLAPLGRATSTFLPAARNARRQLAVFNSITVDHLDEIDDLDRAVLMAESAEWAVDPARGTALSRAVTDRVRGVLSSLGVARRQVTLTSRSGQVPVTVFNNNPFPVRVRVLVQSAKVTFPGGTTRTHQIQQPSSSIDIPVTARAAGSFPLDVKIQTPDGSRTLASGQVILRSTAISAVALSVVGGSAALLLFAWLRRSSRRTKTRATR